MSRKLKLKKKVIVPIVKKEQEDLEFEDISVDHFIDDGSKVVVYISFYSTTGITKELTLWEGIDYKKAGQYTDNDIDDRILFLMNINNK